MHISGDFSAGTFSFSSSGGSWSSSRNQRVTPTWCSAGAFAVTALGGLFRKTIRGTCARKAEAEAATQAEPAEVASTEVEPAKEKTPKGKSAKETAPKKASGPPIIKPASGPPIIKPAPPENVPGFFRVKEQVGVTPPLGFWDPLGICPKDETVFNEFRSCEIKHGRVAMLATIGAIVQHYVRIPGFELTNFGKPLPSGLGAVTETPGTFGFGLIVALALPLELFFWKDVTDDETGRFKKEPGNFGDPLGLGQYDMEMRNRELNNGRMAMFAAFGIIAAELLTGKDAVEQLGL